MARLQSLNERIAVLYHAQKNLTELSAPRGVAARRARQQAGARRLRAGPHGDDHRRWTAEGAVRVPDTLSNNTRPDCVIFLPDQRRWPSMPNFRRRRHRAARGKTEDDRARAPPSACARTCWKHISDIAGKYPSARRDRRTWR